MQVIEYRRLMWTGLTGILAAFEFSWGAVFADLNLDGRQDLLVSENYVGLPWQGPQFLRLPGLLLLQKKDGRFAAAGEQEGVINQHFSITPLTADFNGDGFPDIIHANLAGASRAFLSKGNDARYLKVRLADDIRSIDGKLMLNTNTGKTIHATCIHGEGLCSDSSHIIIPGMQDVQSIQSLEVQNLSGKNALIEAPQMNSTAKLP